MTEKEFSDLIGRYQRGMATENEIAVIEYWLNHRANAKVFEDLSEADKKAVQGRIYSNLKAKIFPNLPGTVGKQKSHTLRIFRWAAAVVLLLLLSGSAVYVYLNHHAEGAWMTVVNPENEESPRKIILEDGSIVWLKENSELKYPEHFRQKDRKVILKGEALFEIASEMTETGWLGALFGKTGEKKPFVVQNGIMQTTVLGTSFQIIQRNGETEVFVLTGKVALSLPGKKTMILSPNEKAVYREDGNDLNKEDNEISQLGEIRNKPEFRSITKGTEYDMFFENEGMDSVANRIGAKFDRKIVLDQRMKDCLIRADLTDRSLIESLEILTETLDAEFEIKSESVYIRGPGCM